MVLKTLTLLMLFMEVVNGWWLLTQMSSASLPTAHYFDCSSIPGLSRKQYEICKENRYAMRAAANGLKEAVSECQLQFANEKWNCSAKHGFGTGFLNVASRESAYVYALSAGAVAHSVAKACARGLIPDCGCGDRPRQAETDFIWAGCSDNIKYGNQFSRKFIDVTEKKKTDSRSKMNLHNNRVGRKLLMGSMKKQCKCHGVSGSCVTKTCWKVVPDLELFASALKNKYERAQQVTVTPGSNELMLRAPISASRTERYVSPSKSSDYSPYTQPGLVQSYEPNVQNLPVGRGDLVFLDASPNYCDHDASNEIIGTKGRECQNELDCNKLCCGRGYELRYEWKTEPCHCKFEWCCEVKCQQCERLVERRFCR